MPGDKELDKAMVGDDNEEDGPREARAEEEVGGEDDGRTSKTTEDSFGFSIT